MLGMDPPELGVAQLVRLAGLFEISENRARVALSRMVAAGEATTNGSGRYRLSGHLVERQSRQSASRSGVRAHYSGRGCSPWSPRPGARPRCARTAGVR